jgi:CHAT domain-containing protein/Tfp pilus assembly protein PilF
MKLLSFVTAALLWLVTAAAAAGDPEEIQRLSERLAKLREAGRTAEALVVARQLLPQVEQANGPLSERFAECLKEIGELHQEMAAHGEAEAAYVRALGIIDGEPATNQLQTAAILASLGSLLIELGRYQEARPPLERALALRRAGLPPDHPDLATSYSFLGWLFLRLGDYTSSESMYEKALDIRQKVFGANNSKTAGSLNDLALLYHEMGDFARAEPLYLQSLSIRRGILGAEHPDLGRSYNDLARLYYRLGQYDKAEEFYGRAVSHKERTLEKDHPSLAVSLSNFGVFYWRIGDYANAEPLLLRALHIKQKALQPDHPSLGTAYHNLAVLYRDAGRPDLAEFCSLMDLKISESSLGTNHAETAITLHCLGSAQHEQHQYADAELAYRRALAIQERLLGMNHASTANTLDSLGQLYLDVGDGERAEPLLSRALTIREQAFGLAHPDTAKTLERLARLKLESHEPSEALRLARKAASASREVLAVILSFTSEEQRLAYQRRADPYSLPGSLGNPELIAETALRLKGIVLDSLLEDYQLGASARDPQWRSLTTRLRSARQAISQSLFQVPTATKPGAPPGARPWQQRLTNDIEQLEAALARQFAGLGHARRALSVTVDQVRRALPEGAALVEFVRYSHFLDKGQSESRYGAIVLTRSNGAKWLGLGSAEAIERNTRLYQSLVRGHPDDATMGKVLAALYQQLWAPIQQVLPKETGTVILSPVGELNFVSFATLLSPGQLFLAETHMVRYVTSGRDLLKPRPTQVDKLRMAIYANPDFGDAAQSSTAPLASSIQPRGAELRALRSLDFRPLPGAEKEARALEARSRDLGFETVALRLGREATEADLKLVDNPQVLHLATHGYFLSGHAPVEPTRISRADLSSPALQPQFPLNPMRSTGLAFAGAQLTVAAWAKGEAPPSANDGLLSAEEVGCLNLGSTWLVVLSACDTALGEVWADEGILGLRRGFLRAGAQNLVLTLWPIEDDQTHEFITDFYNRASRTHRAATALAEVQRAWLSKLRPTRGLATACRIAGPFVLIQGNPERSSGP